VSYRLSRLEAAALAFCFALVQSCARPGSPPGPRTLTTAQWREDLRYFARELPKRHKNLFHSMTREEFDRSVASLDSAIPSLESHQIVIRMKQIAAKVGDGHTGLRLPDYYKLYPIFFFWFGTDLRVIAAMPEYRQALGARVVGIGGVGIEEVEKRVETTFASAQNENEWYVLGTSPAFIGRPEVLQALGVVKDLGAAPFTFLDDQGRRFTLEIRPIDAPPVVNNTFSLTGVVLVHLLA